jgi:hypothetical protein
MLTFRKPSPRPFFKCRNADLSDIRSVQCQNEKPMLEPHPVSEWDPFRQWSEMADAAGSKLFATNYLHMIAYDNVIAYWI